MCTVRNKFPTLHEKSETHIPKEEYTNFRNYHIEAAEEFIPTIPRAKRRVPGETLAVRKKDNVYKSVLM